MKIPIMTASCHNTEWNKIHNSNVCMVVNPFGGKYNVERIKIESSRVNMSPQFVFIMSRMQ